MDVLMAQDLENYLVLDDDGDEDSASHPGIN
jgi:hypothetical protein